MGNDALVANAGLAVVTVWGGVTLVNPNSRAVSRRARARAAGHAERILVNTSLHWGHFVIDLNNALCQALGSSWIPGLGTACARRARRS